jgi:hypothetical protein
MPEQQHSKLGSVDEAARQLPIIEEQFAPSSKNFINRNIDYVNKMNDRRAPVASRLGKN